MNELEKSLIDKSKLGQIVVNSLTTTVDHVHIEMFGGYHSDNNYDAELGLQLDPRITKIEINISSSQPEFFFNLLLSREIFDFSVSSPEIKRMSGKAFVKSLRCFKELQCDVIMDVSGENLAHFKLFTFS